MKSSLGSYQLLVGAALHHATAIKHINTIHAPQCPRSVRHHDRDPIQTRLQKFVEDLTLGFGVNCRCRLIQDPDTGIPDGYSGEGDPLPLPTRKTDTSILFANLGVKALVETLDKVRKMGDGQCSPDIIIADFDTVGHSKADRIANGQFITPELLGE
jgi:hypothetical protein